MVGEDPGRVWGWADLGAMLCPVGFVVYLALTASLTTLGIATCCVVMATMVLTMFSNMERRQKGVLENG